MVHFCTYEQMHKLGNWSTGKSAQAHKIHAAHNTGRHHNQQIKSLSNLSTFFPQLNGESQDWSVLWQRKKNATR